MNARGTEAAMTKAAAVATRVMTRTRTWVVSAGLSVQVNCVQAHQISQNSTSERRTPSIVRLCAVRAVTWVTAKTKTRSKNSSTNVTACSSGACNLRRAWAWAVMAPHCSGSATASAGFECQQLFVARAAAGLEHLHRANAAGVELVLLDVRLERREVARL